jgi:hypothetical protein
VYRERRGFQVGRQAPGDGREHQARRLVRQDLVVAVAVEVMDAERDRGARGLRLHGLGRYAGRSERQIHHAERALDRADLEDVPAGLEVPARTLAVGARRPAAEERADRGVHLEARQRPGDRRRSRHLEDEAGRAAEVELLPPCLARPDLRSARCEHAPALARLELREQDSRRNVVPALARDVDRHQVRARARNRRDADGSSARSRKGWPSRPETSTSTGVAASPLLASLTKGSRVFRAMLAVMGEGRATPDGKGRGGRFRQFEAELACRTRRLEPGRARRPIVPSREPVIGSGSPNRTWSGSARSPSVQVSFGPP